MSPSRGTSDKRKTLLLAIATVTVLHLIVYRSTTSLRSLHSNRLLVKRGTPSDHEPDTDALIDWLYIYRHASKQHRPVVFTVMTLWLIFLFAFVGICASEFFCPNLSHIASRLGLSESVAGVTFLAFSNGSPDVFSTFSALKSNAGSLAIGELIGAASFIVSVVAGTMALITPFRVSRHTFLRDVGFFTLAVFLTLGILYDSHIHLWEALVMVGLYIVYVGYVAVGGWWWSRRQEQKKKLRTAREEYDHRAGGTEEQGGLLEDEDGDARELRDESFPDGAEIEWERPVQDEDEDDVIELPVSGSTTPRSTTGRSITSAFSSDSIIYHSQSRRTSRNHLVGGAVPAPPMVSPRIPRHAHSHFRARSTSLINPRSTSVSSRPPPTPLLLSNSISSLSNSTGQASGSNSIPRKSPGGGGSSSTSNPARVARPSLLGAIEFRDLVNSLNQDRNNASNLLSVFSHSSSGGAGSGKSSNKRPRHSRTNTNTTMGSSSSSANGASPRFERGGGGTEWDWNGWGNGGNETGFGGSSAGRRRASSSPGFRPGGIRLGGAEGGADTLLADGVLNRNREDQEVSSSEEEEDDGGSNPWVGESSAAAAAAAAAKSVKRVPSILLTSENGSDTLLPIDSTSSDPSRSSASSSSLTVRPTGQPLPPPSQHSKMNDHDERHRKSIMFRAILSALFPSLSQFRSKSIVGKLTALMCVPALLVLNLTLPVAEEVTDYDSTCGIWSDEDEIEKEGGGGRIRLPDDDENGQEEARITGLGIPPQHDEGRGGEASERVGKRLHSPAIAHPHSHHLSTSAPALPVERDETAITPLALEEEEPATSPWIDQTSTNSAQPLQHRFRIASESEGTINRISSESSQDQEDRLEEGGGEAEETESLMLERLECEAARKVTRGLTAVQCTLGPVFCAFALFADDLEWYKPVLALILGLFFATLAYRFFHNPRHPGRVTLCFVGFGIAMVWILMIVNEVVGVLQTLGHIFGISDAILGLTIFAMGNSLGDLVANATVARMGYPSMAIAACFGGPMLNILLGVGLSGTYLITASPTHEAIHVEMGRTLIVSGIGLFAILLGSLIVVPMNGYRMTKRIGAILIGAYTIVLSINVVTEIWL